LNRRVIYIFLAILIAPISMVPIVWVFLAIAEVTGPHVIFDTAYFPVFVIFGLGIGYVAAIVVGIPAHLLLHRFGWPQPIVHGILGILLGVLFAVATFQADTTAELASVAARYGLCGLSVAVVFGLIANSGLSSAKRDERRAT
jgi:hypothetical protein